MSLLVKLILLLFCANLLAWFQLQGQFIHGKLGQIFSKDLTIIIVGIPIGWMFWKCTSMSYEHFGAVWNLRMIGFGIGTIVFGIMTWLVLGEIPAWHTVISILLAAAIIMLQFSNLTLK
jgi:hypothetical protein